MAALRRYGYRARRRKHIQTFDTITALGVNPLQNPLPELKWSYREASTESGGKARW